MMKSGGKGLSVDQVVLLKSHKRRNSDTVQGELEELYGRGRHKNVIQTLSSMD